jgi:3-oxoacyl-[acyl-carrier protein] reductase
MGKLDGQVCLVTGAAQGIGRAIALAFGREGADVVVNDYHHDVRAHEVKGAIESMGRRAIVVLADVSSEEGAYMLHDHAAQAFGRVDTLVNNAGIDTVSTVAEMPVALWDEMIRVNLRSVFLCTHAVLPGMMERRFGRIINISSQLAHKGAPQMAHYCAAKAGVIGFTRALAYEVAPYNITVNAIAPGPIDTDLFRHLPEEWRARKLAEIPLGRPGTVDEIAPTAVLLASADGSYYLGATLNPNGGDVMV